MAHGCRCGDFIGDIDRHRDTDPGTALGTDCGTTGNILDFIVTGGRYIDITSIRGQGDRISDTG